MICNFSNTVPNYDKGVIFSLFLLASPNLQGSIYTIFCEPITIVHLPFFLHKAIILYLSNNTKSIRNFVLLDKVTSSHNNAIAMLSFMIQMQRQL